MEQNVTLQEHERAESAPRPTGHGRSVLARVVLVGALLGAAVGAILFLVGGTGGPPIPVPAAPVTPAPAPTSVPAAPQRLGIGDVTGAMFDSAQGDFASHFNNDGDDGLVQHGPLPEVVANPEAPGRQAFLMSLGPGGKRSEVLPEGPGTQPVDGDSQYVRYTAILSPDFPTDVSKFQVVLQWHHQSDDGSPPIALWVADGQLEMVGGGDEVQPIGPISPGGRIDLTMHITFSQDPDDGSVTVWRSGAPTGVTNWHPSRGTMFTHGAYLKMGMYRSEDIDQAGAITITDLKIGTTAASIGGLGPLVPR